MPNAIVYSSAAATTVSANVRMLNSNVEAVANMTSYVDREGTYVVLGRASLKSGETTGTGTAQPAEAGVTANVVVTTITAGAEYWSIN